MNLSRRELLVAGLGLLVTGCTQRVASVVNRPRTPWPIEAAQPPSQVGVAVPSRHVEPPPPSPAAAAVDSFHAIPRSRWTRSGPIPSKVNPMNGVSRITVHHEGWKPVWFTDQASTAARLEQIRSTHVNNRGWGDVGYHYIIDRAGRLWQGRDVRYQGAHVSGHNEHNLGVMVLGNFEEQSPSDAQIQTLISTLRTLMHTYRVPKSRVYTHRELMPTACPGRNLQPRMVAIRRGSYLA